MVLKNLICQTQISNVDRQNFELDLSDTNQQHGSTDSIQTTSGIAQIFQNPVKNKKGANVTKPGFVLYQGIQDLIKKSKGSEKVN